MNRNPIHVLIVEDNLADSRLVREMLAESEDEPFAFQSAERLSEALELLTHGAADLILLDLSLPDSQGLETFHRVRVAAPDVPVVLLTGRDDHALALQVLRLGAQDYLVKGQADAKALGRAIRYAIERQRLHFELEESRRAFLASEERYRAVTDAASDVILTVDDEGFILFANQAVEKVFGYPSGAVLGRNVSLLLPESLRPEDPQAFERHLERGKREGCWESFELPGQHHSGAVIPLEITLGEFVSEGQPFYTGILRDITQRQRAEAALREKEELQQANEFKDQFLSTMSHELRTPLNAILGFSQLLGEERYGALNQRQHRYVTHIREGGKHLLSLINDILDLSKIEAGRMELELTTMRLDTAFEEALEALRPLAEKKSQVVEAHAPEGLAVRADGRRFKQIVTNLLANAIKFTPENGRIELAASALRESVRIEVRDNGPGISVDEQQRIFEAFHRGQQAGAGAEGTGLGLAICRRLVELHGGQLELQSAPGKGTCFFFSLPATELRKMPAPRVLARGLPRPSAPRILVVEDDPAAGKLIESHLASVGYDPILCTEPQMAAQVALEIQPQAITLDMLMRPTNGWEVLMQLKSDPQTAEIPVLVLTVLDAPASGVILGAHDFLVKPVEKKSLLAAVRRCLIAAACVPGPRPILVVEDDAATREIVTEILNTEGHAVLTASDGRQARELVSAALPELVILDLHLPEVGGFELLAEWRSSARTADLPVFILTAKDLSPDEEKYLRSHAESLFFKQHNWQELLAQQLRRVLGDPVEKSL